MKGLILAAGRGSRLAPLTDTVSKPLLPLANRPLIDYPLQQLLDAGITEICIVANPDNRNELEAALDGTAARMHYIIQPEPLGLAHAVGCAREFCGGSEFVLLFADNVFLQPLETGLAAWRELQPNCIIHTIELDDPRAFGVAVLDGQRVVDLEEKPAVPRSNHGVIGIDIFTPEIFEAIDSIQPSARGEYEITDAMMELVRRGRHVHAVPLIGPWYDTGTFADLIRAHHCAMDTWQQFELADGIEQRQSHTVFDVDVQAGTRLDGARLIGPVRVASGCEIVDSVLEEYVSVGRDCRIQSCHFTNVQLMPGSRVRNLVARDCIIAPGLQVTAEGEKIPLDG
ncbi:MAG: NTP transferase domain-containing protein [Planctomycetales bacterium]|nr:NTP transferase domain-containing protein [bacterium]UNM09965.1 MAG: NTP transferase domain-containing protein [Planctomycetales bacterium]